MSYLFEQDGVRSVQKIFTGAELDAFQTTPLEILPSPGAGFAIYPLRVTSVFVQTGSNIYAQDSGTQCCWDNNVLPNPMDTNGLNTNSTTVGHPRICAWDFWKLFGTDLSAGDNKALRIQANFDWDLAGEPVTHHLSNPGTGYSPSDVSTIGGTSWALTVDTVDGGGGILTYHISHAMLPGAGAAVGASFSVDNAGNGDATIDVDTIQPGTNGKFTVNMQYLILPTT